MFPLFLSLELGRRKSNTFEDYRWSDGQSWYESMLSLILNALLLLLCFYYNLHWLLRGWLQCYLREQGHCVASHKITYLSIAHEIKSNLSRYKAYWFLGKWALNIYYYHYYYLSKAAIGCTCYLFARLHHIFCSYLSPCTQHLYL
jgi:hypothetical protein